MWRVHLPIGASALAALATALTELATLAPPSGRASELGACHARQPSKLERAMLGVVSGALPRTKADMASASWAMWAALACCPRASVTARAVALLPSTCIVPRAWGAEASRS